MSALLKISHLQVEIEDKLILKGLNLSVKTGEVVAIMGPNGSGKSTLAHVLAGNPAYNVVKGSVKYLGRDLLKFSPEARAKQGIFLSWQHPQEIAGVTMGNFLRLAYNATHKLELTIPDFLILLKKQFKVLALPNTFIARGLNEGFSGGEKKKAEILQMLVLEPKLVILDETDSGLDIDALKIVSSAVKLLLKKNPKTAVLLITHYQRIMKYLPVTRVVVVRDGVVKREGSIEIIDQIEKDGYVSL